MFRKALFLLWVSALTATILDRVDIIVGTTVITELQLDEDLRVTAFLNGAPISETATERRAAANRLIQQVLIRRDMEMSQYPSLPPSAIDEQLDGVRAQYDSPKLFSEALIGYGIGEEVLRTHLANQARILRFVGYRFRPDANVSDDDLRNQYRKLMESWSVQHPGEAQPNFRAAIPELRSQVLEGRTDEALNAWLEDARTQVRIVFLDQSLAPVTR